MREIKVPVLIVGAGGSGSSLSNVLADLGVESLLIERHPTSSELPRAHYLNQRTMDIYRHHGIADAVYARSTPRENLGKVAYYSSLGGGGPLDGIKFMEVDAHGGGATTAMYDLAGPAHPTHLFQSVLEPILQSIAEQRNPGRVLFNHQFMSLTQDETAVRAVVQNRQTGEEFCVKADYLLGADGGKAVGATVGVKMLGEPNMQSMVSVHIKADLSDYVQDDSATMINIIRPGQLTKAHGALYVGVILSAGPARWGRHSEEWVVVTGFAPDDPDQHDEEAIVRRARELLKVDVPFTVRKISTWQLGRVTADTFKVGRVILIGDAAHQHAPGGGLGINSGIQDAHNVAWKLAMVLAGKASPDLLDTYEIERRPVVERNSEYSMFAIFNGHLTQAGMGIVHGAPVAFNEAQFAKLIAQTPDGESRRARLREVVSIGRIVWSALDMEVGFQYREGALVDDGAPWPSRDPLGHVYTASTHPGCRLPHAWLRYHDKAVSTHDLIPMGGFLLLTGTKGSDWCVAARKLAVEMGITLHSVRVSNTEGDASDPSGVWAQVSGIESDGAVLVRPDGHVAWRINSMSASPRESLALVLGRVLLIDFGAGAMQ